MKVEKREEKKGRARDEYKNAMLNALCTNFKRGRKYSSKRC